MAVEEFSISGDTLNGTVDAGSLHTQVAATFASLVGVSTSPTGGDTLYIEFEPELDAGEKVTLAAIVGAHTGEPVDDFLDDETGWNITVENRDLTSPPGSPNTSHYYIVGASATGEWASHDNAVARWNGTNWQFQIPASGFAVYIKDEGEVVVWDGSSWGELGSSAQVVFGNHFQSAQSPSISTTTSTRWQPKVKLTTGTLEAGTYILLVSYGWSMDSTSSDFEARVLQGDTDIGQHHVQEPTVSKKSFESTGTDQRHYASRHFVLSLSQGSYTYHLQHRSGRAGSESSMWDATLSFWRVI